MLQWYTESKERELEREREIEIERETERELQRMYMKELHYRYLATNVKQTKSKCSPDEDVKCSICGNSSKDIDVWKYENEIENFNLCRLCLFCVTTTE
jgi:hypothetical protein